MPLWRWLTWSGILAAALFVFYVIFTPFWMATRALAWLADFRAAPPAGLPAARQPVRELVI